jgi:hypothetical protein
MAAPGQNATYSFVSLYSPQELTFIHDASATFIYMNKNGRKIL